MSKTEAAVGPIYLPNLYQTLYKCNSNRYDENTVVVAVGGKIMSTDGKDRRLRWRRQEAAREVEYEEQQVGSYQRRIRSVVRELRNVEQNLASAKENLKLQQAERDAGGRSAMRLDYLRSWVSEHMPSVLAMVTNHQYMRFRFCAAVTRGAGKLADAPNRFVIPAMWITVDIDTGKVVRVESDGNWNGAFHPHASMGSGDLCTGYAVPVPKRSVVRPSDIKGILTGIEKWRLYYGDDVVEHTQTVAQKVWDAVAHESIGLAPIQGTTGLVYENLNTLLQAEPWDGAMSNKWCVNCNASYIECGCCPDCGSADTCNCGDCSICGQTDCNCCTFCERVNATWGFRGSGNEHEVCRDCGYCRLCGQADVMNGLRGAANVLSFLTVTDITRIQMLVSIENERGCVRPGNYLRDCDCSSCQTCTRF